MFVISVVNVLEAVYVLPSSSNSSVMVLPSLPMSPPVTVYCAVTACSSWSESTLFSSVVLFLVHHERADSAHIAERYAVRLHDE